VAGHDTVLLPVLRALGQEGVPLRVGPHRWWSWFRAVKGWFRTYPFSEGDIVLIPISGWLPSQNRRHPPDSQVGNSGDCGRVVSAFPARFGLLW